jgi:hypothetical protein
MRPDTFHRRPLLDGGAGASASKISVYPNRAGTYNDIMKKYICVLLSAGLLAACEQKTESIVPGASPSATVSTETTTTSPAAMESPTTESTDTTTSPSP